MSSPTLIMRVAQAMGQIAPLALADRSWDNVGVLLDSPSPNGSGRVVLTIDLTPAVMEECLAAGAEVIVAYHPPIFSALKRLTTQDPKQRVLLQAARAGVSVYSPHTSLDAAAGGINDWLADLLAPGAPRDPIIPADGDDASLGMGRVLTLPAPQPLDALVAALKAALGLPTVRVALPEGWEAGRLVASAAVCAGSGSGVFRKLRRRAEVLVSGEMGHHDVLAATAAGQAVVLTEHTNSERGYLQHRLAPRLRELLGDGVEVSVAAADRDPLVVW